MSLHDLELGDAEGSFGGSDFGLSGDGYAVKLPVFEGPLDLLLHLIRQNEVEITDIPIAEIAPSTSSTCELMRELNLDVAGEYLVMAATLALDQVAHAAADRGRGGGGRGHRPARRAGRAAARVPALQGGGRSALGDRRLLGRDVFAAQALGLEPPPDAEREIEVGLFELIEAFRLVLANASLGDVHEVETESVSVRDRMLVVMERLECTDSVEFNDIFAAEGEGSRDVRSSSPRSWRSSSSRVSGRIRIYQGVGAEGAPEGPIRLRMRELSEATSTDADATGPWRERISELM